MRRAWAKKGQFVGKIIVDQSVSLDGFSAGVNVRPGNPLGDRGDRLHEWYSEGGSEVRDDLFGAAGAMVMGRTMFDVGVEPWGENPPFHMPIFVVTHRPRAPLVRKGGTTYVFMTEGLMPALERAKSTAGAKNVVVMGGAQIVQQCMNAGVIDEIRIHLAHVLLGEGTRLFKEGHADTKLTCVRLAETPGATHFTFNVQ
jgi:dihydrofolate reductase